MKIMYFIFIGYIYSDTSLYAKLLSSYISQEFPKVTVQFTIISKENIQTALKEVEQTIANVQRDIRFSPGYLIPLNQIEFDANISNLCAFVQSNYKQYHDSDFNKKVDKLISYLQSDYAEIRYFTA